MTCPHCQALITDSPHFCPECGRALHPPRAVSTPPAASSSPSLRLPTLHGFTTARTDHWILGALGLLVLSLFLPLISIPSLPQASVAISTSPWLALLMGIVLAILLIYTAFLLKRPAWWPAVLRWSAAGHHGERPHRGPAPQCRDDAAQSPSGSYQ